MLELQAYHIFINSLSTRDYAQGGCPPSLVEALPKLLLCASGASASLRYIRIVALRWICSQSEAPNN